MQRGQGTIFNRGHGEYPLLLTNQKPFFGGAPDLTFGSLTNSAGEQAIPRLESIRHRILFSSKGWLRIHVDHEPPGLNLRLGRVLINRSHATRRLSATANEWCHLHRPSLAPAPLLGARRTSMTERPEFANDHRRLCRVLRRWPYNVFIERPWGSLSYKDIHLKS